MSLRGSEVSESRVNRFVQFLKFCSVSLHSTKGAQIMSCALIPDKQRDKKGSDKASNVCLFLET